MPVDILTEVTLPIHTNLVPVGDGVGYSLTISTLDKSDKGVVRKFIETELPAASGLTDAGREIISLVPKPWCY